MPMLMLAHRTPFRGRNTARSMARASTCGSRAVSCGFDRQKLRVGDLPGSQTRQMGLEYFETIHGEERLLSCGVGFVCFFFQTMYGVFSGK